MVYTLGRVGVCFLAAFLVTYCLASISQSVITLLSLQGLGVSLSLQQWINTLVHDIYGFSFQAKKVPYALLVASGLTIAFVTGWLICRCFKVSPYLIYTLAGASAMACILTVAHLYFFGEFFYSATRTLVGKSTQVFSGAFGGYIFALVLARVKFNR